MLVVGGVVLALVLLTPTGSRVTRTAARSVKPKTPTAPKSIPITPDPTVKPKTPTGPKLPQYKDTTDNRPISNIYSMHLDDQAKMCRQNIYDAGTFKGYNKGMQAWGDWLKREFSPSLMWKLAQDFLVVCREEKYPLDLAIGHAYAESNCTPAMKRNSAGAIGPLQVTEAAARQVGENWPPFSPQAAIRIGVKYMKWIRRTYPEARSSIVNCLRIYGMGYGGFQEAMKQGCPGKQYERFSVWQSECGRKAYVYTQRALEVAKNCTELHTVRWDKWTGKE